MIRVYVYISVTPPIEDATYRVDLSHPTFKSDWERLLFQVTTRIILTLGLKIGGYKKF
jgi:hypothetical protein